MSRPSTKNILFAAVFSALGFCFGLNSVSFADIILIDYDDGMANGIHDSVIRDGEFTTTTGIGDPWDGLGTGVRFNANGGPDAPTGSARNYVSSANRTLAINTSYTIRTGDTFDLSYQWIDKLNFVDATDTVQMVLYFTDDDTIGGSVTEELIVNSGLSTADSTWETVTANGLLFTNNAAAGKTLFARIDNLAAANSRFARHDNIYLKVVSVPEPGSLTALACIIAIVGLRRIRRQRAA